MKFFVAIFESNWRSETPVMVIMTIKHIVCMIKWPESRYYNNMLVDK